MKRLPALCILLFISVTAPGCSYATSTPKDSSPTPSTIQTAFAIATMTGAAYDGVAPPFAFSPVSPNQTDVPAVPVTGGTSVPAPGFAVDQFSWPERELGSAGPEVFAIQCLLRERGYNIPRDGNFDIQTQNAVIDFQKRNGIPPSGIVDALTFPALIQIAPLQKGQAGDAVRAVQRLLRVRFNYAIPASGAFNEQTDAAVKEFQDSRGLIPDGIVGPETWRALLVAP
jgi:peptidoglycan hydrolase-like protein with peptidoglycan-binding domain